MLTFIAACTRIEPAAVPPNTELRIGVPESNADGTELGVGQLARTLTSEGLTQLSAEGRALPRLADSWTWEDDERTLRLRLHPQVTLHDGKRLDAATTAAALTNAIGKESNRASYPALADIMTATPRGDREVVLTLRDRSPLLPVDLTVLLDIPAGPFRITRKEQNLLEFARFEQYYQGVPSISTVTIRPFDTMRTSWASLLRGELDMVYDVPVDAVDFVRNDDIEVVSVPRWYQYHLTLNAHDRRFKSPLVRRALNMAVNRQAIVEKVLKGAGDPSGGPIYPKYWSFDSTVPAYTFDPMGAASLLDAAGYRLNGGARTDGPPTRLQFTCVIPKGFAVWERVALEVQKDLANVGVDMQFKTVALGDFDDLLSSGRFEAAFINMISGPTPSRPYMWWRSARGFTGPYNVFGYENAEAERLFEVLLRSSNEAAIRAATSKLQRVLRDDPPAVFIAWDTRTRAISRRFDWPNDGRDPMWTLAKWTLASRQVAAAP